LTVNGETLNSIGEPTYRSDVTHSVSARQKNNRDARSDTKSQGTNPPTSISGTISIADFLQIVNTSFDIGFHFGTLEAADNRRKSRFLHESDDMQLLSCGNER
jgi:hypothetical protein